MSLLTPVKQAYSDGDQGTIKIGSTGKEKITLPSILEGFAQMQAEDYEMLAEFEEEQSRKGNFELIFPTLETVEKYGGCF